MQAIFKLDLLATSLSKFLLVASRNFLCVTNRCTFIIHVILRSIEKKSMTWKLGECTTQTTDDSHMVCLQSFPVTSSMLNCLLLCQFESNALGNTDSRMTWTMLLDFFRITKMLQSLNTSYPLTWCIVVICADFISQIRL